MENKETFSKKEIEHIYRMKNEIEDLIKTKEIFNYYIVSPPTATDKFTKHSYDRNHVSFVIAGGVFASIFHKEPINDIDVFILGEKHIIHSEDWITPNYDSFSTLIRYKDGRWNVQFRLDEDDNYHNPHVFGTASHKESGVQYIMTDHLTRQDLLKNFDFVHCTVSYHEGKLNINRGAYDAIANKKLIRQNLKKDPKKGRVMKFLNKGFSVAGEGPAESKTKALIKMWEESIKESADTLPGPWAPVKPAHIRPKGRIDQATESQWDNIFVDALKSDALEPAKNPFTFDMTIRDKTDIV